MHESRVDISTVAFTFTDAVERVPRYTLIRFLTPLVGREEAIAGGCALVREEAVRLLTLTGTGGVGKTRLGMQIATNLQNDFDEVLFISLAAIRGPAEVIPTLAHALGLRGSDNEILLEHMQAFLHSRSMLLLLDNFEHVVSAAPLLTTLLSTCPFLKILVTSRAVLHIQGEYELPVHSLQLPTAGPDSSYENIKQSPAIVLFVQRARAVKHDFQLTVENAPVIAQICARLDGVPLALELAAARIKLLSPAALLARLERPLHILTAGTQDTPPRQKSLRDTIAWSYDLLSPDEQTLFRRLAVFEGGCQLEAVEALCAPLDPLRQPVLDLVAQLVDKGLLQQNQQNNARLLMLETIREFAREHLLHDADRERVQEAHAEYYVLLVRQAESELYHHQQRYWLSRLEEEHQNIRAALVSLQQKNERQKLAAFIGTLDWFWYMHGFLNEGRQWAEYIFTSGIHDLPIAVRAKIVSAAGVFAGFLGQGELAFARCQESLPLCKEAGNVRDLAASTYVLTHGFLALGELTTARTLVEESLAFARAAGDAWAIADLHCVAGSVALYAGDYARARSLHEHGIALIEDEGDLCMKGLIFMMLADVELAEGHEEKASRLIQQGKEMLRGVGAVWSLGSYFSMWGQVALGGNHNQRARFLLQEALRYLEDMGDQQGMLNAYVLLIQAAAQERDYAMVSALAHQHLQIARSLNNRAAIITCLETLAILLSKQGEAQWATHLWSTLERLSNTTSLHQTTNKHQERELLLNPLRKSLGKQAFAQAWAQGQKLTPEQAIVAPTETPAIPPTTLASAAGKLRTRPGIDLTKRELDVLQHLAQGRTNAQIADQLTITITTVNSYLRTIYSKLGVSSRTSAIRSALDLKLI